MAESKRECNMCGARKGFDERHTSLCESCTVEAFEVCEIFLCTTCEVPCLRGFTTVSTLCDKCLEKGDVKTCEKCGQKAGRLYEGKCGVCNVVTKQEFVPSYGIPPEDMEIFDEFEEIIRKKEGSLTQELRQKVFSCFIKHEEHCDLAVYDPPLLKLFLSEKHSFSGEELRSAISRCVERKLPESLELLLGAEKGREAKEQSQDKRLFLRWVGSIELYIKARGCGWIDVELEKRITAIQRAWRCRKKPNQKVLLEFKYEGPDLTKYEESNAYFGYRHAMYAVRWDRKHRFHFYSQLLKYERWSDCAWQAYVEFLGESEKDLKNPYTEE
jgi:hypothetical protein